MNSAKTQSIKQNGKTAQGRKELLKHLSGGKLTFKQAIYARCYDCMGYYADGKTDCDITECPLYPFMPYKEKREKRSAKELLLEDNVQDSAAML